MNPSNSTNATSNPPLEDSWRNVMREAMKWADIAIWLIQIRAFHVVYKFRKQNFADPVYTLVQGEALALIIAKGMFPIHGFIFAYYGFPDALYSTALKISFYVNLGLGFHVAVTLAALIAIYRFFVLAKPVWYFGIKSNPSFNRRVLNITVAAYVFCAVYISPMLHPDILITSFVRMVLGGKYGPIVADMHVALASLSTLVSFVAYFSSSTILLYKQVQKRASNKKIASESSSSNTTKSTTTETAPKKDEASNKEKTKNKQFMNKQNHIQIRIMFITLTSWVAMSIFVVMQLCFTFMRFDFNAYSHPKLDMFNSIMLKLHYCATTVAQFALNPVFRRRILGLKVSAV